MATLADLIPAVNNLEGIQGHIDQVDELEVRESGGVIRYLKRKARVVNLPHYDFTTLYLALEDAGIPSVPSRLTEEGFDMLRLTNRDAKLFNGDPSTVDVILEYKHVLDGENQELDEGILDEEEDLFPAVLYGKMKCSLKEKKTNTFDDYIYDEEDPPNLIAVVKTPISLKYTYPAKHAKHPGETKVQGGEITIPVPQKNYKFGGYIATTNPDQIVDSILGRVNSEVWRSEDPRTWLCVEVGYEAVNPFRYRFDFEFQHDPDTWDNYAVFIDEDNKRPPPDLVDGVGKKTIQALEEVDYDSIMGRILGSAFFS